MTLKLLYTYLSLAFLVGVLIGAIFWPRLVRWRKKPRVYTNHWPH